MGSIVGLGALPKRTFVYRHHEEVPEEGEVTGGGSITQLQCSQRVKELVEALGNSNVDTRRAAASDLGRMEKEATPAVPALAIALGDSNKLVRGYAAIALGRIGKAAASAVPALIKESRDSDAWIRRTAAEALAEIRESQ